jgi:hypothetical protein
MYVRVCHVKGYQWNLRVFFHFLLNHSNCLLLTYFLLLYYHGNAYNQNKRCDVPKLEYWIFDLTKEFNTKTQTNSKTEVCCQRSIHKSSNSCQLASTWKIIFLSFCHHNFLFFVNQNIRQHSTVLLARNWKKHKEASNIKSSIVAYHYHNCYPTTTTRLMMDIAKLFVYVF